MSLCDQKTCPIDKVRFIVQGQLVPVKLEPNKSCCRQFAEFLGVEYNEEFKNQLTIEETTDEINIIYTKKRKRSNDEKMIASKRQKQQPPLQLAIDRNDLEDIKTLASQAEPSEIEEALQYAIKHDKLKIVQLLNPYITNDQLLLRYASEHGKARIVEWLLGDEYDPDLDEVHEALKCAIVGGHLDVVKLLIPYTYNDTYFIRYAAEKKQDAIVNDLLKYKALKRAVITGDIDTVKKYLPDDIDAWTLSTLLQLAVQPNMFHYLLHVLQEKEKKEDIEGYLEKTLNLASEFGHRDMVQSLLQLMQDPNKMKTALHQASKNGDVPMVRDLLEKKVQLDKDIIKAAIKNNHPDVIDALVQYNPSFPFTKYFNYAILRNKPEIVQRFLFSDVLSEDDIRKALFIVLKYNKNQIFDLFLPRIQIDQDVVNALIQKPYFLAQFLDHLNSAQVKKVLNLIPGPITDLGVDMNKHREGMERVLAYQYAPGGTYYQEAEDAFEEKKHVQS